MNASYVLPDGKTTGYGVGTWVRQVIGKHLVGHGGYIFEMDIDFRHCRGNLAQWGQLRER